MNEQWPRYWAELFARRGYVATDPFRAALWEHPDVKWWFAQNSVCFATPDALARTPVLAARALLRRAAPARAPRLPAQLRRRARGGSG